MSQVLINQYFAQLDVLKKVGGTHRESVVREAFKDLLKGWGKQHDLVFIAEYKLDSATTLGGVPPEAWAYTLGNRCAIDWVLDQYKEKKPKDPTIRAKFDTYRFADYKETVIDLLMRVTTVSVETMAVVEAMKVTDRR